MKKQSWWLINDNKIKSWPSNTIIQNIRVKITKKTV